MAVPVTILGQSPAIFLSQATVVEVRPRFHVPDSVATVPIGAKVEDFVNVSVTVSVGGVRANVQVKQSEKTIKKKILRAVGLNLNSIRSKAAAMAMDGLVRKTKQAAQDAVQKMDMAKYAGRLVNLSTHRMNRQAKRDAADAAQRYKGAVQTIRQALTGPARKMSLEDLTELWKECTVENVLHS
jgi:hypothetical protein